MNVQDFYIFWQPIQYSKREALNKKTPAFSLLVIYNDLTEISNASVQLASIILDKK